MAKNLIVKLVSRLPNNRLIVAFNSSKSVKIGDEVVAVTDPSKHWRVTGQNFAKNPNSPHAYLLNGFGQITEGDEVIVARAT